MASKRRVQNAEQLFPTLRVEQRREAATSHNTLGPQTIPVDPELIEIDHQLSDSTAILNTVRKKLHDYGLALGSANQKRQSYELAYREEYQRRIELAQAYGDLYTRHERAVDDVNNLKKEYLSQQEQLQNTVVALKALESSLKEHKNDAGDNSGEYGISQSDWDMVEQGIAKEQLEVRIMELEKENSAMKEEHNAALMNAANHIAEMGQRYRDLEQMHSSAPPTEIDLSTSNGAQEAQGGNIEKDQKRQNHRNKKGRKARKTVKTEEDI